MKDGIYEILNTVDGKRYIGSAVHFRKRWNLHRSALRRGVHHNQFLQSAWQKYGEDAFSFSPVMLCESSCLLDWERKYISEFEPEYNVAIEPTSPMLGRKHSPATKAKQSASKLGKPRPIEMRLKMLGNTFGLGNKSQTGKMFSAEHRKRLSESLVGNKRRLGIPHSAESLAKMSAARKGRPWSAKRRAALEKKP